MTDRKRPDWNAATWEGQRRAMLRGALRLNVRERLQALENLCDTDRFFRAMREQGRFRYGEHDMNDFQQEVAGVAETQGDWRKEDTRNEIPLTGCTPVPLASYLKALGILRLVAEQADANARGYWTNEHFVLVTKLNYESLTRFFLNTYHPTPILSPWNGRAGFLEGEDAEDSQRKGAVIIKDVVASKGSRFSSYREVIEVVSSIPAIIKLNAVRTELKVLDKKKKAKEVIDEERLRKLKSEEKKIKASLLTALRSSLPDEFIRWIDACLVISENVIMAPLLGMGGVEGSMDFSTNHLIVLTRLIDKATDLPTQLAKDTIAGALTDSTTIVSSDINLGFLSPASSGGANMGSGFLGTGLENPWNEVFMLEGAVLFAASATRRLEVTDKTAKPALSFPFAMEPVAAGHGSVSQTERTRHELWMPLWVSPLSFNEIAALLGEGRATLGQKRARNAMDMARSIAGLGVDRGITEFQRYGLYERRGQGYYVGAPLSRFKVKRNPNATLIHQLDRNNWLSSFREAAHGKNVPKGFLSLAHHLEDALFDLTRTTDRRTVQQVLVVLGMIQMALARSPGLRDEVKPVPLLGRDWVFAALDGSDEFRIAAALAGLDGGLPMRVHLAPIDPDKTWDWKSDSRLAVWRQGAIENNLVHVLERRLLEADCNEKIDPWMGRCPADLSAVAAFLGRMTDDRRIAELVAGLACCHMPDYLPRRDQDAGGSFLPAAYALMKPLFTSNAQLHELGVLRDDQHLPLPTAIPRLLRADRTGDALRLARQRRRASGLPDAGWRISEANISGPRLLAALMLPMTNYAIKALESRISMQNVHESERTTG